MTGKAHVRKSRQRKRAVARSTENDVPVGVPEGQPEEVTVAFLEDDERRAMIARHAYYLAEQRGFEPGHELDDWLTAERDVEGLAVSPDGESHTLCGE